MEENQNKHNLIKIVIIGETNVGKTTIFHRFCENTVDKSCISTIGVEFKIKNYKYKNKEYSIQLFDTAGQERFRSVTEAYYKMGNGFLVVFDLTNEDSLNAIKGWIEQIHDNIENPKYIIVGNKDDIDVQLPLNVINGVLSKYTEKNIPFIKTSAFKNTNINKAIETMIDIITNNQDNNEINEEIIEIKKKNKKNNKKDKCCL